MTKLDATMASFEAQEQRQFWEWLDSEIARLSPDFIGPHQQTYPAPASKPLGNVEITYSDGFK